LNAKLTGVDRVDARDRLSDSRAHEGHFAVNWAMLAADLPLPSARFLTYANLESRAIPALVPWRRGLPAAKQVTFLRIAP
jgi:hypothetical protein